MRGGPKSSLAESGEKDIVACSFCSKSLPNKGYGQSSITRKEWVMVPLPKFVILALVHEQC